MSCTPLTQEQLDITHIIKIVIVPEYSAMRQNAMGHFYPQRIMNYPASTKERQFGSNVHWLINEKNNNCKHQVLMKVPKEKSDFLYYVF